MNDKQRRRTERGQRVDVFMDAQVDDFPPDGKGGRLAASLKELLDQVATLDVARTTGAHKRRQGTEGVEALRNTLRHMVSTVYETAKTIALDHPEIKGLFSPAGKNNNGAALLAAARASAQTASSFSALFAEYGLAASFFTDMAAKIADFEAHVTLQKAGAGAGVDARAALEETVGQLDETVERLNTVVTNKYAADPAKLVAWESARRVERAPRSKTKDAAGAPTPPAANN